MRGTVYNSAISNVISNPVNRAFRSSSGLRHILQISFVMLGLVPLCTAADWNRPEQELARKIVTVTGPGAVAVTIENRSSLGKRDSEIIQNGLRSALEALGIRFVTAEQSAATVTISLSENAASYVWVAEIRQGTEEPAVVMVSAPRPPGSAAAHESVPLSLHKVLLWAQDDPVLDVAVLEESTSPTHIAVLSPEQVSLYRWEGAKWQQEQMLEIVHARPWPRDLRGRLVAAKDHLLDVNLPGVSCASTSA
jgi:hypothetical protein